MRAYSALNRFQPAHRSHILLYHATYEHVPPDLKKGLHNVVPDELFAQVRWLQKYFDLVSVDDYLLQPGPGKAAITFDDAYSCIFTETVPGLIAMNVPATIFIIGTTLAGGTFWRDKVRFLMNSNLVDAFLSFYLQQHHTTDGMTTATFYGRSKMPTVNSKKVDETIDAFLQEKHLTVGPSACLHRTEELVHHPLITYGNHTFNHYVAASLTAEEQREDIAKNKALLESLKVPLTQVFSIPFGSEGDYDDRTLSAIQEAGYRGVLLSENRLETSWKRPQNGLPLFDRYMAERTFPLFQKEILGLWGRSFIR